MKVISKLNIEALDSGVHNYFFNVLEDFLGNKIRVPLIVVKSKRKGPLVCANALIHGDELNGLDVIHKLIEKIDNRLIKGTFIALPVFNMPGFMQGKRHYSEGIDLNHIMPGKPRGKKHEVYVSKIISRILSQCNYHLDLHTARSGSRNSYYLRADLSNSKILEMSKYMNSSIILDHVPTPTTLRGSLAKLGIPSITFEIGDPLKYQKKMVDVCCDGILRFLESMKMFRGSDLIIHKAPLVCRDSIKVISEESGIFEVFPEIRSRVKKGECIAVMKDIFGQEKKKIFAPISGIIIGKISNPVITEKKSIVHIGSMNKIGMSLGNYI